MGRLCKKCEDIGAFLIFLHTFFAQILVFTCVLLLFETQIRPLIGIDKGLIHAVDHRSDLFSLKN
jgi:hypothetical protein